MAENLETFIEKVNGTNRLRVEYDFGGGFVRLQTSEAERRQALQDIRSTEDIVIELLRNARDAHAARIFVAMWKESDRRFLTVIDDGDGVPESMHKHIFEPRVTSKLDTSHIDSWGMHGRGMALYSISQNTLSASVALSSVGKGTSIHIESDTRSLSERKDQSTFPSFELKDDKSVNVRGPRNILRTVCEFAIDARAQCSIYIGTPSEISATLYSLGCNEVSAIDRIFCKDVSALPVTRRLATTSEPSAFAELAKGLALPLSERTARRIIDGDILPLRPILDRIRIIGLTPGRQKQNNAHLGDSRSFKLHMDDSEHLSDVVKREFADIAERYYLEPDVDPIVRTRKDRITITIPIVKQ